MPLKILIKNKDFTLFHISIISCSFDFYIVPLTQMVESLLIKSEGCIGSNPIWDSN